jgi:asparagine synthetase B (glutamine-hydrolysing)
VILRRAMKGKLPASIVEGAKRGFGVPVARWWNRSREFARGVLEEAQARRRDLLSTKALKAMAGGRAPRNDREATFRWSVVCFELWAQAYLDGTGKLHQTAGFERW